MSSQVSGAGSGNRPVGVQSQDGVQEAKSGDLQKTPENTAQPGAPRSASPQEKSQKQMEKSMEGAIRKNLLHEDVHAKEANSSQKTKGKGADGTVMTELAKTLGELESKQAAKVKEKIKDAKPPTPKTMAEAQAEAQKMNTLQQSSAQVIKSVGDALSNAARK